MLAIAEPRPPKDFHGEVVLKTGVLVIRKTGFDLAGCKVGLDASYGSVTPMSVFFDFHIAAEDLDIKRAYHEIALIRELAPAAEYAEGIISLDYAIKGRLDSTMYPVMESLEGGGTLSLRKVKVKGFRLFNDIGKKTQKEELKNPDMSKVDITTSINEKVITLEPFKFKVSGIHVRIGGTAGMDNRVNLRIRLGLPPLGIFGIPMKVTGAMDDPVIKFGRGREGEEIQEEEYTDELPQELIDRIRNAREEEEPEIH